MATVWHHLDKLLLKQLLSINRPPHNVKTGHQKVCASERPVAARHGGCERNFFFLTPPCPMINRKEESVIHLMWAVVAAYASRPFSLN